MAANTTKGKLKPAVRKKNLNEDVKSRKKGETKYFRQDDCIWGSKFRCGVVILLGVCFGVCHSFYVSYLHESSRHFSHLSTLEREMNFRTEMGFYYYFYKVLINSPDFFSGLTSIINNKVAEYPSTINALERFNVYPEVLLSIAYKMYTGIMNFLNIRDKTCWFVNRGDDLPPIESCEGLGDPAYFYVNCVWLISGVTIFVIFIYSTFLSKSIFGGVIAVLCFFYNHGECTRVQWTPPLRESFGYPVFLIQMFYVSKILSRNDMKNSLFFMTTLLTVFFIISWQLAVFVLTTQLSAVFGLYTLNLLKQDIFKRYLVSLTIGVLISSILLFFNRLLITSILIAAILAIFFVFRFEDWIKRVKYRWLVTVFQLFIFCTLLFLIKKILTYEDHDAHIWNLLRAKFTNYTDFHTLLYTCAPEFDFIELHSIMDLNYTLLIPVVVFVIIVVLGQILHKEYWRRNISSKTKNNEHSDILYNFIQLSAFAVMAILIMRLKLFFTPHLCIISSLIAHKKFFHFKKFHVPILVALIALMSVQGVRNVKEELEIVGEYSNPPLEELFHWVNKSTSVDASFAGPMPIMANLMLSTERPIVNHPHYEDANLRERTKQVYTLFSRKPVDEVYNTLKLMQVDYAVLDEQWCYRGSRKGCALLDLWDREDEENVGKMSVCDQLRLDPKPFRIVFQNEVYLVIQV